MASVVQPGNTPEAVLLRDKGLEMTYDVLALTGDAREKAGRDLLMRMVRAGIPSSNSAFRTLSSVVYASDALKASVVEANMTSNRIR
jgi:hypothetical protein